VRRTAAVSAFTLIELVIVIAIVGILATLAIPKMIDLALETKIAASKAGLGTLRSLLATRYAASATGGGVASYPTYLSATDFGNQEPPDNQLLSYQQMMKYNLITALTATTTGMAMPPAAQIGYWYVSLSSSSDYGKSGAYGANVVDTSNW
jgi:prepilin-type N-terminal cleavage/methylation domain-containing protein